MEQITELLEIIQKNPMKTADVIAEQLGITRQSASRKLKGLRENELVSVSGRGRSTRYELVEKVWRFSYEITDDLDEFLALKETLLPLLKNVSVNVAEAFQYGFTEMFNNAIDHSEGTVIDVEIRQTPLSTVVIIEDNGRGIFEKIQQEFNLVDIRQSIFELSKGKLTTDSNNHTGEGIFFSSKIFDLFVITSKGWAFVHNSGVIDLMYEHDIDCVNGTRVMFELQHNSCIAIKNVFDQFTTPNALSFAKTVVKMSLAKDEGEFLISRSQAKRVVERFERFETVILDFSGVSSIGQGFSDQIFRIYQREHPNVELISINANLDIQDMINRSIVKNF